MIERLTRPKTGPSPAPNLVYKLETAKPAAPQATPTPTTTTVTATAKQTTAATTKSVFATAKPQKPRPQKTHTQGVREREGGREGPLKPFVYCPARQWRGEFVKLWSVLHF